eukprot:jgi/Mesen1/5585/ME000281S04643
MVVLAHSEEVLAMLPGLSAANYCSQLATPAHQSSNSLDHGVSFLSSKSMTSQRQSDTVPPSNIKSALKSENVFGGEDLPGLVDADIVEQKLRSKSSGLDSSKQGMDSTHIASQSKQNMLEASGLPNLVPPHLDNPTGSGQMQSPSSMSKGAASEGQVVYSGADTAARPDVQSPGGREGTCATAGAKRKRNLPGTPDPEAEVVALSPKTLMATNRFVCEICNKGFQRDQNLQLHRRGHNLPWKLRQRTSKEIKKRVYICPEPSCVHHDPARALGDLTGIKKHFCRKHGEKKYKCDKCSKRYAVQSDWKAHLKTCGTREYRCDCGTLFSRRDSFITHRAFCDALADTGGGPSPSKPPMPGSGGSLGSSGALANLTGSHLRGSGNLLGDLPSPDSSRGGGTGGLPSVKREGLSIFGNKWGQGEGAGQAQGRQASGLGLFLGQGPGSTGQLGAGLGGQGLLNRAGGQSAANLSQLSGVLEQAGISPSLLLQHQQKYGGLSGLGGGNQLLGGLDLSELAASTRAAGQNTLQSNQSTSSLFASLFPNQASLQGLLGNAGSNTQAFSNTLRSAFPELQGGASNAGHANIAPKQEPGSVAGENIAASLASLFGSQGNQQTSAEALFQKAAHLKAGSGGGSLSTDFLRNALALTQGNNRDNTLAALSSLYTSNQGGGQDTRRGGGGMGGQVSNFSNFEQNTQANNFQQQNSNQGSSLNSLLSGLANQGRSNEGGGQSLQDILNSLSSNPGMFGPGGALNVQGLLGPQLGSGGGQGFLQNQPGLQGLTSADLVGAQGMSNLSGGMQGMQGMQGLGGSVGDDFKGLGVVTRDFLGLARTISPRDLTNFRDLAATLGTSVDPSSLDKHREHARNLSGAGQQPQ